MSEIKNGGLDQCGKVLSLNGIGSETVKHIETVYWTESGDVIRIIGKTRRYSDANVSYAWLSRAI